MNNSSKQYSLRYLYILVMLSMTFQLFNFLPIFDRHYIFIALGLFLAFLYAKKMFYGKYFTYLVLYLFLVILNWVSGDDFYGSTKRVIDEFMFLFLPPAMLYSLKTYSEGALFKTMFIVFMVFLLESTVVSVVANIAYPGIMRMMASGEMAIEYSAILLPFQRLGMSDYAMPHAIPALLPGLVYLTRNTKGIRMLLSIICIGITMVLVYVSNSSTALLLSVIILLFSFLVNPDRPQRSMIVLFFCMLVFIPFFFNTELQINVLEGVNSFIPEDANIHKKIVDIQSSIAYGDAEGSVENRTLLYQKTMTEFFSNPLIGSNNPVGGHAALLDRLATLGIIGFIPLVMLFYSFTKSLYANLPKNRHFYFLLGLIAALIMLAVKSSMSWALFFVLFFLLPGLLMFLPQEK